MDVGKDEEFTISTQGAGGQGQLEVKITSPSRRPIPCKLESDAANEVHTVKYMPPEEGPYRVEVGYDGNPVPGSPFVVDAVLPPDPTKVRSTCRLRRQITLSPHAVKVTGAVLLCRSRKSFNMKVLIYLVFQVKLRKYRFGNSRSVKYRYLCT